MANITKIEPKVPSIPLKKKVAAYARVSLESERLLNSLSNQVSYYSELIQSNPDWEYAGVYADEGISGTQMKKRDEFNRLLADCDAGKIDIVLTKSISRFARNTVDLLNTVRHLKELGISVRFEKENIDSLSSDGEVMLTLLASFAQSESESISANIKWAKRKKIQQGVPGARINLYGYRWEGEVLIPVPEEAAVVKRIYQDFLDGLNYSEIVRGLNAEGFVTSTGLPWRHDAVISILTNPTYTGNLLLQRYYVEDPITHVEKVNHGELPQYWVENSHEAIVDLETYKQVQAEIARRREIGFQSKYFFTGKIKCPCCGVYYNHRIGDYWSCHRKRKGKKALPCPVGGNLPQKTIEKACCEVLGLETFDEQAFLERVDHIEVPERRKLVFFLKPDSKMPTSAASLSASAASSSVSCDKVEWAETDFKANYVKRFHQPLVNGANGFSSLVVCSVCGKTYRRIAGRYYTCPTKGCRNNNITESELRRLSANVLRMDELDEDVLIQKVERINVVPGGHLKFCFFDGRETTVDYPVGVKIVCSVCGKNYKRTKYSNGKIFYRCPTTGCPNEAISEDELRALSTETQAPTQVPTQAPGGIEHISINMDE